MVFRKVLLAAAVLFIAGCLPGITVSKKDAKTDARPLVEYRMGTDPEMKDWVVLKESTCKDLEYATEGLPDGHRKDILNYACVETNRVALGEVLEKLQPGELDRICARFAERGYNVTVEKVPTALETVGAAALIVLLFAL